MGSVSSADLTAVLRVRSATFGNHGRRSRSEPGDPDRLVPLRPGPAISSAGKANTPSGGTVLWLTVRASPGCLIFADDPPVG